jgi:hypothetical protein
MKYLCLIYLDENRMAALPWEEMRQLNVGHLALNDRLRASGHLIAADALEPGSTAVTVKPRRDKVTVVDGPYTETKELVAGFYLLEARDIQEAASIAAQFPGAQHGAVEIRPIRELQT